MMRGFKDLFGSCFHRGSEGCVQLPGKFFKDYRIKKYAEKRLMETDSANLLPEQSPYFRGEENRVY